MIAMDLGFVPDHFWSAKTSKNWEWIHILYMYNHGMMCHHHSEKDHLSLLPRTIATHQSNLDCIMFDWWGLLFSMARFVWYGLVDHQHEYRVDRGRICRQKWCTQCCCSFHDRVHDGTCTRRISTTEHIMASHIKITSVIINLPMLTPLQHSLQQYNCFV